MAYDFNKEAYYGDMTPSYVPNRTPGGHCPQPSPSPSPSPSPFWPLPDVDEQSERIKNGDAMLGDVADVMQAILKKADEESAV